MPQIGSERSGKSTTSSEFFVTFKFVPLHLELTFDETSYVLNNVLDTKVREVGAEPCPDTLGTIH